MQLYMMAQAIDGGACHVIFTLSANGNAGFHFACRLALRGHGKVLCLSMRTLDF
jgi:hypothetical protein